MKETKTARGGSDCPTLLHYLARVLLLSDPSLINFMDDMPHLEAAARSMHFCFQRSSFSDVFFEVSVQTVAQSVNALFAGLVQVKDEIIQLRHLRNVPQNDKFIDIMQVRVTSDRSAYDTLIIMILCFLSAIRSTGRPKCGRVEEHGSFIGRRA